MQLPVLVGAWEIKCCQPDIVVGEQWTARPVLTANLAWMISVGRPSDWRDVAVPVVEAEAQLVSGCNPKKPLVHVHGVLMGADEYLKFEADTPIQFLLFNDSHSDCLPDGYPPEVEGRVVELYGLSHRGRDVESLFELGPVRLDSTALHNEDYGRREPRKI